MRKLEKSYNRIMELGEELRMEAGKIITEQKKLAEDRKKFNAFRKTLNIFTVNSLFSAAFDSMPISGLEGAIGDKDCMMLLFRREAPGLRLSQVVKDLKKSTTRKRYFYIVIIKDGNVIYKAVLENDAQEMTTDEFISFALKGLLRMALSTIVEKGLVSI